MRRWGMVTVGGLLLLAGAALSLAQRPAEKPAPTGRLRKPQMSDTIRANLYADNWCELYVNGELVAVDSIKFLPHNVVAVDLLPTYPLTIAVQARDNADPRTGMEYANTSIGDGGFILKFSDGTVTNARWKALCVSRGPLGRDVQQPRVENLPVPASWFAVDFDDRDWPQATEYTQEQVAPKQPFFEHDFAGARFIWSSDLELDNTVLFRTVVPSPPDGRPRPDFSRLNDVVPDGPPRKPKRG